MIHSWDYSRLLGLHECNRQKASIVPCANRCDVSSASTPDFFHFIDENVSAGKKKSEMKVKLKA